MEEEPLLDVEGDDVSARRGYERFYVLFVFFIFAMNQGMCWLTYSSVDIEVVDSYFNDGFTPASVNMLLNWGSIMGMIVFPFQCWIVSQKNGFYKACMMGALCGLCANISRIIPVIAGESARRSSWAYVSASIGQMFNALVGPLCMATTSRLSRIWFEEKERTFSTAIAVVGNGIGTNAAFIIGPYATTGKNGFGDLLYFEFALSLVPIVLWTIYFPKHPADIPEVNFNERGERETVVQGLRRMLSSRNYRIAVVCAGFLCGIQIAWQSLFQQTLKGQFTEATIGWFGFLNGIATNVGAILMGYISLRHRLRNEIIAGLTALLITTIAFGVELARCESTHKVGSNSSVHYMLAIIVCSGFCYGAVQPLFYELCAKLVFPINEGASVGLMVFLLNFASFFAFSFASLMPSIWMTYILIAVIVVIMFTMTQVTTND
mmetsp:Transcript_20528/g.33906  ORF Transcript_20528/g.33906 Transcript_20528/m.33906 type:complete len:434 (-) Transcript_20528:27-1328(-)